jgi:hypothetical protein
VTEAAAEAFAVIRGVLDVLNEISRRDVMVRLLGDAALESRQLSRSIEARDQEIESARRILMARPGETLVHAIMRVLSENARVEE